MTCQQLKICAWRHTVGEFFPDSTFWGNDHQPAVLVCVQHSTVPVDGSGRSFRARSFAGLAQVV